MRHCQKINKPFELSEVKKLEITKGTTYKKYSDRPMVCLSFDRVILCKIKPEDKKSQSTDWLEETIKIEYEEYGRSFEYLIYFRPKLMELLNTLDDYVFTAIYSSESDEFIDAVLVALAQKIDQYYGKASSRKFDIIKNNYFWSQNQCIQKGEKFLKSLGVVEQYSLSGINNIWLIDDRPELVDFTSHVIPVSSFKGDPEDLELFRVMHQIFLS